MSNNRLGYLDAKREEFRRYLELSGVMDAFTKVLVGLYEEADRPKDALEYVKKHLGNDRPEVVEVESIKTELEEYKARLKLLESENEELKRRLGDFDLERTHPDFQPELEKGTEKEELSNE
ncbi:c-Myc-binding protein homolog [Hetaerina americana]|uniref:c-Myc-binding protein homolog n=1 Tax=Hetaerina americana TaxID=62018 RepID=UPI003A7F5F7B